MARKGCWCLYYSGTIKSKSTAIKQREKDWKVDAKELGIGMLHLTTTQTTVYRTMLTAITFE